MLEWFLSLFLVLAPPPPRAVQGDTLVNATGQQTNQDMTLSSHAIV